MATECAMHLGRKLRVSNGTTRLIHVSVDIRIQLRLHDRARIHGLLHHSNYAKTVLPQVKTGSHPLGMSCVNCEIRSTSRLGAKIMLSSSYLQGDFEFGLVQERIHCWGLNPETSHKYPPMVMRMVAWDFSLLIFKLYARPQYVYKYSMQNIYIDTNIDHKLLQESTLSARHPCRAPTTLYVLFNQRRHLASKELVNLTRYTGFELGSSELHTIVCYPLYSTNPSQSSIGLTVAL